MAEDERSGSHIRSTVPRWVKVLGLVTLAVVVVVVVVLLVGGDHGPGRHM